MLKTLKVAGLIHLLRIAFVAGSWATSTPKIRDPASTKVLTASSISKTNGESRGRQKRECYLSKKRWNNHLNTLRIAISFPWRPAYNSVMRELLQRTLFWQFTAQFCNWTMHTVKASTQGLSCDPTIFSHVTCDRTAGNSDTPAVLRSYES